MMRQLPQRRRNRHHHGDLIPRFRPTLEILESRIVLAAPVWPVWLVPAPGLTTVATLDSAQPLALASGPVGSGPIQAAGVTASILPQGGAGEVDWYSFTLDEASEVRLAASDVPGRTHLDAVLSLYQSEGFDPFYPLNLGAPPYDSQQYRLLAQVDVASGEAGGYITQRLAAGTYYVAVSGSGNRSFSPFLASSGYGGDTGNYRLLVTATPLPGGLADQLAVLRVAAGSGSSLGQSLSSSPLALYIGLNQPIDPGSVILQQPVSAPGDPSPSVRLLYSPTGKFGPGYETSVLMDGFYYAEDVMELRLKLAAPLDPGYYRLILEGNPGTNFNPVLTDASGNLRLGQNAAHPDGQDFVYSFRITGVEGRAAGIADDTPAGAREIGTLALGALMQATGAVGDDPTYDPALTSPFLSVTASDVDMYHFRVTGPGTYAFSAEVFAGRIGSTLDPAISLFRLDRNDPSGGLTLIASNDNSGNTTLTSNGLFRPLFTDSLLDAGLTAGDYYLVVSSSGNMPDLNGNAPGVNGVFDPRVSHSGSNGNTTGAYVLNLLLSPMSQSPRVLDTSIAEGATLTTPPTRLTVTFDSHVNLLALASQAYEATSDSTVSGVFIVGPDGQRYFPRLESYDDATGQATFLLLDRLPSGTSHLHFSGPAGLTGYGGVLLTGNDPSGDYVVSFRVEDPSAPGDALTRDEAEVPLTNGAYVLGVLFPRELQAGVSITGVLEAAATGETPETDVYTIQLLQQQTYHFTLGGPGTPTDDLQLTIRDAQGTPVILIAQNHASALSAILQPGIYTLEVNRSLTDSSTPSPYTLLITFLNVPENPPPLAIGARPLLGFRATSGPWNAGPTLVIPPGPRGGGHNPILPAVHRPAGGDPSFPVLPASDGTAVPGSRDSTSPGVTLATQLSLIGITESLRADLVGGVARDPVEVHATLLPLDPLQGAASTAWVPGNRLASSAVLLTVLFGPISGGDADLASEEPAPGQAAVWDSWQKWLGLLARGLDVLSAAIPPNIHPTTSLTPFGSNGQSESPALSTTQSEATPKPTEAVQSLPSIPVLSEVTAQLDRNEESDSETVSGAEHSVLWFSALLSTALAAFLLWKKAFHALQPSEGCPFSGVRVTGGVDEPTRRLPL